MSDDVKKNQDLLTKRAMLKEMQKRYSPGASTGGNYTFKHLGHEIIKFDGYTRGK